MYVNTNMADTSIVCLKCTIILGHARPDLMAKWLADQTLEPEDQGRFLGEQLIYIVFPSFVSVIMLNYFQQVI